MEPGTWWPEDADGLAVVQTELAARTPQAWRPPLDRPLLIGGSFCCFPRGIEGPGGRGDPVWVAAVAYAGRQRIAWHVRTDTAGAAYVAGSLAMREGPALAAAVGALEPRPDVMLVDATGRDHPRRAGLAYHLGAALNLPTVGVTHRPLLASGEWPGEEEGAASPLWLADEQVGAWVRTRRGRRPLVVHAGWRTDPDVAVEVVRRALAGTRTPLPLREARRLARRTRAQTRARAR